MYYNGLYGLGIYSIFLLTYSIGALFLATVSHYICKKNINKNNDWDYHTVVNSGDYLVDSTFAFLISGGFNVHGLHHLFPSIHPSHLGGIYHLFEKRCREYNYPYTNVKSWDELFRIYVNNLYILGNMDYKVKND